MIIDGINLFDGSNDNIITMNGDGVLIEDGANSQTIEFSSTGIDIICTNGNEINMESGKVTINGNFEVDQ